MFISTTFRFIENNQNTKCPQLGLKCPHLGVLPYFRLISSYCFIFPYPLISLKFLHINQATKKKTSENCYDNSHLVFIRCFSFLSPKVFITGGRGRKSSEFCSKACRKEAIYDDLHFALLGASPF